MKLSVAQRRELHENGFIVVPGVIPPVMIRTALRAINQSIGDGMSRDDMPKFRASTFCPELTATAVITDLLHRTPSWSLSESAIGPLELHRHGQVNLRFPTVMDPPPAPIPQIDGIHSPHNGVPKGELFNFTASLGVFLSDITDVNMGNYTVWPGSHHIFAEYLREMGPRTLLNGFPVLELPAPYQITLKAGDIVLSHYLLAHGTAPNISQHIRYACFFRLYREEHAKIKWDSITDTLIGWDGVREALGMGTGALF
ncbi:MAG: phytanoyl-CoA dioxygenase family protein [Candidatus Methylacidiphilales bacterium]|nr:phytanoyl-CoA dioxygenase family protein [Candidatus Methylacidiphilales bacterium]